MVPFFSSKTTTNLVEHCKVRGTLLKNFQNDELLLTHYCGLQNKPISKLTGNNNGVLSFATDSEMSGLTLEKDTYVTSWEINLLPEDDNQLMYKYTVSGPDGDVFTATSTLSRI